MRKCTRGEWVLFGVFLLGVAGVVAAVVYLKVINVPAVPADKDKEEVVEDYVSDSRQGEYRYAAVAADAGPCSQAATDVMARQGGSAVDAAIVALLCTSLHNPHSMGIGGGFFMTVYEKASKRSYAIDAREVAPQAATEDMYADDRTLSKLGGKAIGVPGEIKGYHTAHTMFGRLAWKDLFQHVIRIAEEGVEVSQELNNWLPRNEQNILNNPGLKSIFINNATGKVYKLGDTIKRPKYAETLKRLAEEGAESMYSSSGSLAQEVVADIRDEGGIITTADLDAYEALVKEPLNITLRDNSTLYSTPPPGSGAVVGLILNILDGFHLNRESMSRKNALLTYHRIAEASKFAFAKRTELGDENFLNIDEFVKNITSKSFAEWIQSKITSNSTHDTKYYGPTFANQLDAGTTHISLMAPNGDAVSVTSTINHLFGSKVAGVRTGIIFNSEMDDFSTPNLTNAFGIRPSPANFIAPGKRPLSSMCPTIVVDNKGDAILVVGASGGPKITTATAQVVLRSLFMGYDMKEAIDAKRLHHQLLPKELQMEEGFPKIYKEGLEKLGHAIKMIPKSAYVQGILRRDGELYANSDFRKGGYPDGY